MALEVTLEDFADKRNDQDETFIPEETSFAVDDVVMNDRSADKIRDTSFLERWAFSADKYLKQPIVSGLVCITTSAASRPMLTIIACLLLSLSLLYRGLATNFKIETRSYRLWEPTNSYLTQQQMWLKMESGFDRKHRYYLYLLLHANGGNVLDIDVASALFDVLDTVQNTEGWSDVCALPITNGNVFGDSCLITSATNVWGGNRTQFEQEVKNSGDLINALSTLRYSNGEKVTRADIFGITKTNITGETAQNTNNSSTPIITHASAYKIDLAIPRGPLSEALEENVQNNVLILNSRWKASGKNCIIEVLSDKAIDREIIRGIKEDIPLMASSFLIMGGFVSLILAKWDRVESQSMLGIGAVVTVGLATISGYGLLFCIGVPFSPLTAIFPFVLVGIGLDDTFIIMGSLSRTDRRRNIIDRVGEVFNEVGIGILASTLTTVLAFSLGVTSRIPAIRWFALYAAPSVLIDFVFQITFFVALISCDDARMKGKRHDCPLCCRKRHTTELTTDALTDIHNSSSDLREHDLSTRIWLWYSHKILLQPLWKMIVLVAFLALAGIGSFGASQQSQQFDTRTLLPPDSFVVSYFHSSHEYTDASSALVSADVIFRNMDVSLPDVQNAMSAYVHDLAHQLSPYMKTTPSPRHFWLRDFQSFVQSQAIQNHCNNATSFGHQLDVFLNTEPFSSIYKDDIVRDKQGVVTASRTTLHFDAINEFDSDQQIRLLQTQYDITQSQPLNRGDDPSHWNMFTFGPAFTYWEITRIIPQEIVTNICMGLLATAIMSIILIPHPIGFLLLPLVVGVIYVELLGLLRWANLYVNAVTAIGLTMGIGLVVDYNIHMVMAYFECVIPQIQPTAGGDRKIEASHNHTRRIERVQQVVLTMGKSIFLCAMSTLFGILPLCGSSSEVFWSFFVTFMGIVFLGASHGLILMPVLLSLFGPILPKKEEEVENEDDNNNNNNNNNTMIIMNSLSD